MQIFSSKIAKLMFIYMSFFSNMHYFMALAIELKETFSNDHINAQLHAPCSVFQTVAYSKFKGQAAIVFHKVETQTNNFKNSTLVLFSSV